MLDYANTHSVEYWNGLKTKDQLYAEFNENYNSAGSMPAIMESQLDADADLKQFYSDKEFSEVAKKVKEAGKNIIPLLKDILKHLPPDTGIAPGYTTGKYTYEEYAEGKLADMFRNFEPTNMAIYVSMLVFMLDKQLPDILAEGMGIPEKRAARQAFRRFMAYKKEEMKRREEFEKTESYRVQVLEMKAGERDHIDYPD